MSHAGGRPGEFSASISVYALSSMESANEAENELRRSSFGNEESKEPFVTYTGNDSTEVKPRVALSGFTHL